MTCTSAQGSELRSLADYAWKVVAPREFVINILINAPIAMFVYRHTDRVPLVGWLSLLVICGPMSFILPTLTTFFGTMNGVIARACRRAGSPWPEGARWKTKGWLAGLRTSAVVGPTTILFCCALDHLLPGLMLTKWMAVTVVALYGGVFGFLLHGRAVSRVDLLYNEQAAVDESTDQQDQSGAT